MGRRADATIASNREMNVTDARTSFGTRKRWVWWVGGSLLTLLLLLLLALGVTGYMLARRTEPFLRARIVETLSAHFHARVELDSFHLALGNGLRGEWGVWADGRGLRIWPPAEVEGVGVPVAQQAEPLIQLDEFRFHAPLRYEPGVPVHISQVQLRGLAIDLPPRSHFLHMAAHAGGTGAASQPGHATPMVTFRLDSIDCNGANLVLETSKPGKLPIQIAIAHLKLTGIAAGSPMHFDAELTNPKPVGTIHTTGMFGPWQTADPGESPIEGDYLFEHADLASFKGIAGILTSTGHYKGTVRDIQVDGETDTPDFRLANLGSALALHTRFHATVDGTDGDTWLDPVDATLAHSHMVVTGQIVRVLAPASEGPPHSIGHDIDLKVNVDRGRIEDFLRLASHGDTPLLTGDVTVKTTIHIPPGPVPVHERMTLDGSFVLDQAQFSSAKIQDRIRDLSLRGQGRPGDLKSNDAQNVESHMQGDFRMADGTITLPNLDYTVPGAEIQLKGTYGLAGGALDFIGTAKMQASVSKMVGGWKGFLLTPADHFFKKNGAGTEVPIHVSGTREKPDFGIDLKRMKSTSPERPGGQPAQTPAPQP